MINVVIGEKDEIEKHDKSETLFSLPSERSINTPKMNKENKKCKDNGLSPVRKLVFAKQKEMRT